MEKCFSVTFTWLQILLWFKYIKIVRNLLHIICFDFINIFNICNVKCYTRLLLCISILWADYLLIYSSLNTRFQQHSFLNFRLFHLPTREQWIYYCFICFFCNVFSQHTCTSFYSASLFFTHFCPFLLLFTFF